MSSVARVELIWEELPSWVARRSMAELGNQGVKLMYARALLRILDGSIRRSKVPN